MKEVKSHHKVSIVDESLNQEMEKLKEKMRKQIFKQKLLTCEYFIQSKKLNIAGLYQYDLPVTSK